MASEYTPVGNGAATCGHHGGRTKAGEPCRRRKLAGLCATHEALRNGQRPPPRHLSRESAELWKEVTAVYHFAVEGLPILEIALTALDRARQARREIEKVGLLFVNQKSGTPHANPMLKVERDAQKEFRLAWRQLDLDVSPPED